LQEDDLGGWGSEDLGRLRKLVDTAHAQQARVLLRHLSSLENAKRILRLGVDLISLSSDRGS
jgi:seryl-tRNA(Sec) selenium transferase